MQDLVQGVARFQRNVFPGKAPLFARLATTHRPDTLFIGCSDARVVPELITQREPGELFVIRTAGNLVPAYASGADGVTASIEYAVTVLGVSAILVCGHSACGAMTALADDHDLAELPAVAHWLRQADVSRARIADRGVRDGAGRVAALVRDNVATQLGTLATHPSVARALAAGTLSLHGWVYDIGTGTVEQVGTGADVLGETVA
ncbi:carbonic anhydrase [Streptacidiphilus sp. PB12-B1b]|uniref:carbonic anhydrase n=1 Tax=Streptacidiphilus sp. PB12-B1b TaxID=2705012 RepID=UPI0015FCB025|nr:carbonic anhydrase [Streptacidiphilus sp. PB12-B1b]QMU77319.1 carbonic anhydrase [Streptacidiphilus sp. PB12-B1b]